MQKLLFLLVALTLFGFTEMKRGGVYMTAEDYQNNKLKDLGQYKYATIGSGTSLVFLVEDQLVTHKLKDLNCVGFQDHNGIDFVIDNNAQVFQVVIGGPIMLLTNPDAPVERDAMGNILALNSENLYYTDGPGGKQMTLKKLLQRDPAVWEAYKADNSPHLIKAETYVLMYNKRQGWAKLTSFK